MNKEICSVGQDIARMGDGKPAERRGFGRPTLKLVNGVKVDTS